MSGRRFAGALAAYALMAAAAVAVSAWYGRSPLEHPAPWLALGEAGAAISLAAGAALALGTIVSTRWLLRRAAWARALRVELRLLLEGASGAQLAGLGIASGLAEELLFRGALQPIAGWALTSLAFGLLHVGPRRTFLPWTVWAVAMGLVLGAIFEATGSLAGPLAAHVAINTVNLRTVARHDARLDHADGRLAPPRLVGRPRRDT